MTVDAIFPVFKKALPAIKKNVALSRYTTFKIGGAATYFLATSEKSDIVKALKIAKKYQLPYFILGGGSNLLVSDKGFSGLVVKIQAPVKPLIVKKGNVVEVMAGVPMSKLVAFCVANSLQGLEWAGGLPGTFGGAVRGNAGAFGGETKDAILEVLVLDDALKLRKLSQKQCQFSYRNSIVKQKNWIIISAKIVLKKGDKKIISQIAKANMQYRKDKHPLEYPNAGSIFKNQNVTDFSKEHQTMLLKVVKKDPFPVVPVAYLLSELGVKGNTVGKAQVSPKHPNFIVNLGGAKAEDVLRIIENNKKHIKEVYGVELEQEVQFLD